MSFSVETSNEDEQSNDDEWLNGEDEDDPVAKEIHEKRRKRLEEELLLPPCDYNNCLVGFVKSLAKKGVQFKVFGGAAYVHYACDDKSEVEEPHAACRTHDVDLYLRDTEENKIKFEDAFAELQMNYKFIDSKQVWKNFGGIEPMVQIKWRTKVDSGDAVEHGIDVHYVGDELKGVRLWDDWDRLSPDDHKHFVTKAQLCESLHDMVEGKQASHIDGDNKGERRMRRYEDLCVESNPPST